MRHQARLRCARRADGFSLLELLLAMSLGLLFCGVVIQALLGEGRNAQRFTRLLRESTHQRRALALVRSDLERATAVVGPAEGLQPVSCGLAGRSAVLQLRTRVATGTGEAIVTYSVGAPPSGIWQGQVLVRCGPAYGLDGGVNPGSAFQSRVVLDGLATDPSTWAVCGSLPGGSLPGGAVLNRSATLPFSACLDPVTQLVALRLEQSFPDGEGRPQRLSSEAVAGLG